MQGGRAFRQQIGVADGDQFRCLWLLYQLQAEVRADSGRFAGGQCNAQGFVSQREEKIIKGLLSQLPLHTLSPLGSRLG